MRPIDFTPQEVLTYLPSGWQITDEALHGTWLESRQQWQLNVQDGADVNWLLQVPGKDVAKLGRIEALKLAFIRIRSHGLA
jgi:hypothetical protein